ncbi:MAG: pdxJ [bacterium]|nr:pdxJ [bacterium]
MSEHARGATMKLHVNVDHVATLRQARGTSYPDPLWAAALVELAGGDGVTVHLREDRRHIQDRDVRLLRQSVRGVLNLEMAATDEMVRIAREVKPDVVSLVPEKREERTTEGGLDVLGAAKAGIARAIEALAGDGIPVSLFIDPSEEAVAASKELGAPRVELHTGDYCEAWRGLPTAAAQRELARIERSAVRGAELGLHVAAGHGLDYGNVGEVAAIREIEELNIGHAIVARAVLVGMERAVREMREAIERVRGRA